MFLSNKMTNVSEASRQIGSNSRRDWKRRWNIWRSSWDRRITGWMNWRLSFRQRPSLPELIEQSVRTRKPAYSGRMKNSPSEMSGGSLQLRVGHFSSNKSPKLILEKIIVSTFKWNAPSGYFCRSARANQRAGGGNRAGEEENRTDEAGGERERGTAEWPEWTADHSAGKCEHI